MTDNITLSTEAVVGDATAASPTAEKTDNEAQAMSLLLHNRNATYAFLSRLFRVEVDEDLYDTLKIMEFPTHTGCDLADEGYRQMWEYLSTAKGDVITSLAVDYVRAFIGSGNTGYSAAYPFESVYTSPKRLLMQDARDDVLDLYHAAGLEKRDDWKDSEDHIALELEYMQILGERAANAYDHRNDAECQRNLLCQKHFLEDHLYAWYPMMASDMEKFPKTLFYQGLGKLTHGFLRSDLDLLQELLPDALDSAANANVDSPSDNSCASDSVGTATSHAKAC